MKERDLYNKATVSFCIHNRADKLIEEMAELTVAIKHSENGKASIADVLEEMADVEICLNVLKLMIGEDEYKYIKQKKLFKFKRFLDELS